MNRTSKPRVREKETVEESPITISVVEREDQVVVVFDREISWVKIDPVQAMRVAEQMKTAAIGILRRKPETR